MWRSFAEARSFVHTLHLPGEPEWRVWAKSAARPPDIPTNPNRTYADEGWVSWGDWLGTGSVATYKRSHRPFEQAVKGPWPSDDRLGPDIGGKTGPSDLIV